MTTLRDVREHMARLTAALDELDEGIVANIALRVADRLAQHAELVAECEQRLRQCGSLLEAGLRDEALDLAHEEPALLDAVDLIDMQSRREWPTWAAALAVRGIPLPAPPSVRIAYQLREAKERLQDLKEPLDAWRRTVLAGRSLPDRIDALRTLHRLDRVNPAWKACLKEHEQHRLMEIEGECRAAEQQKDMWALASLLGELEGDWTVDVPERLANLVSLAHCRLERAERTRRVSALCTELTAAFLAKDLDTVRSRREEWRSLVTADEDADPPETSTDAANGAVEWADRHDRLRDLSEEIRLTLDGEPVAWIERREWTRRLEKLQSELEWLAEKLRDEIALDPITRLGARVKRAVEQVRADGARRSLLRGIGMVAVTTMVLAAGYAVITLVRQMDQVTAVINQLDEIERRLLEGEDVGGDVVKLTEGLATWLAEDPVVIGRLERVALTAAEEDERRKDLAAVLEALDAKLDEAKAVDRPDPLIPWPDALAAATHELASLVEGELAKTDDEETRVVRARSRVESAAKTLQRRADELIREKVAEFDRRLALLEPQQRKNPKETRDRIKEIISEIDTLEAVAEGDACPAGAAPFKAWRIASDDALRQVQAGGTVRKTAARLADATDTMGRFERRKKDLDLALGDWKTYEATLRALVEEFPDRAESRDYKEVAEDVALWQALDEWNGFVRVLKPWAELSPADAKVASDRLGGLSAEVRKFDFVADFVSRAEPAVQAMNRPLNQLDVDLRDWVNREWVRELAWVVTLSRDQPPAVQSYYCRLEKPQLELGGFKYQREWKVGGQWPPMQAEKDMLLFPGRQVKRSPQAVLGDQIENECLVHLPDQSPGLRCDEMLLSCLDLVVKAEQVDPLVRIVNIRKFIKTGRESCETFRGARATQVWERLSDRNGEIEGIAVGDIAEFLDPKRDKNRAYQLASKQAQRLASAVPPAVTEIRERIARDRRFLTDPGVPKYACVGRLDRSPEGRLAFVSCGKAITVGDIYVASAAGRMELVGTLRDDGRFEPKGPRSFRAGSPCYARKDGGDGSDDDAGDTPRNGERP